MLPRLIKNATWTDEGVRCDWKNAVKLMVFAYRTVFLPLKDENALYYFKKQILSHYSNSSPS